MELPEIKPEVQKEEKREEGGLLGSLLSKLGGGAAAGGEMGAGAAGAGGFGGAGAMGGLLATKAGIVALIVCGTTVAGGLGVVGWKAFGPGSDDKAAAGSELTVFAPKPPTPAGSEASGEAGKDGNSQSLSMVATANTAPAAPAVAEPAKAEDTKVEMKDSANAAATSAAASASASAMASNNANVGGNRATSLLKGGSRFGELSKGGGGGGTSATSGGSSGSGGSGARGVATGQSSALGGAAAGGATRGIMRKASGGNGAFNQGLAANSTSRGATSMQAGGVVFDGGGAHGGTIGGNGGIALTGAGVQGGRTAGKSTGGTDDGKKGDSPFKAPPDANGKNVTPWQKAINTAMMLIAGAALLLMAAAKLAKMSADSPWVKPLVYVCAGIAAAMGLAAIVLGGVIAHGEYGQVLQGAMFAVAGAAITVAAADCLIQGPDDMSDGNPTTVMYVAGAVGIGAAIIGTMAPKKTYDASKFHMDNGSTTPKDSSGDTVDWGVGRNDARPASYPSEHALDEYLRYS
jgi:hypothetical protein